MQPRGWRFIDLALLGRNTAGTCALALLRIILYPVATAAVIGAFMGVVRVPPPARAFLGILLQFLPIIVGGWAVGRAVESSHRRPFASLIAPDLRIDWRRLAIGLGVELAILGGQLVLVHVLTGWTWKFAISGGRPLFVLVIVLIPLQAASEELVFRGYMTQELGRIVRSRLLIAVAVGLAFGLLHLNKYGPLTVAYFFAVSLVFSLVSLRDERLELAIGGHSAMNLFAFVAANSGLVGAAIGGIGGNALVFNWAAIGVLMVNGALFYGLTRLLVRLFCEPRALR